MPVVDQAWLVSQMFVALESPVDRGSVVTSDVSVELIKDYLYAVQKQIEQLGDCRAVQMSPDLSGLDPIPVSLG